MKLKPDKKKKEAALAAIKSEEAMIEGIIEGSPDAVGVAVVRLQCGCRKMAAVAANGEPASKVIIYRDSAQSICDKCKEDDGAYTRVKEAFIHWVEPAPGEHNKKMIEIKALGTKPN
ncbi:MAG: hypothetical protein KKE17_09555 [Proteobacteria bacterium]|nr:hypothetical protein [Pseudomonadota bacterium]MBU1710236.1 hypothetical protein [Pseudomonadota bacterium]